MVRRRVFFYVCKPNKLNKQKYYFRIEVKIKTICMMIEKKIILRTTLG